MCPELDKNDTVCYPLYIFGRRKQRATSAGTSTSQEVMIMKKLLVLALAAMMLLFACAGATAEASLTFRKTWIRL